MLKLNKIIFIIFSILIIYSCEDFCDMTDYESYLPLEVGNKWYYNDNQSREIISIQKYDGDDYYKQRIESVAPDGTIYSHYVYFRFYGPNLYRIYNDIKFLIADFSLKEGDSFKQESTGFDVIVISDDPNGFTFLYDHPEWADEEYEITFKKDVGITSECNFAWAGCTNLIDYELY